jgi:peptidyl-prolyl cis-trans isomerase SurA
MKKKYYLSFVILILNLLCFEFAFSKNSIVVKVGDKIVTSYEVENEIKTILFLNKRPLNQESINKTKDLAIKELIRTSIKKIEIEKYNVTNYNSKDLDNYLVNLSKILDVKKSSLNKKFNQNSINYEILLEKVKTDLIWNSLIFAIYKNQISINAIEVENEITLKAKQASEKKEYKLSEIQIFTSDGYLETLKKIKETISSESFSIAAKKYSVSPSSENSGDIGWFFEETLNEKYRNELKTINKGDFTSPIMISESAVILKIDDIKITNNKNLNLEKIKDEIIFKKKEEKLRLFSRSHFSKAENEILINFL